MTRKFVTVGAFLASAVFSLAVAPRMLGQAAAPAPAPAPTSAAEATEETVKLSPFVVSAEEDTGYQATATLAGTRVRTDLKDVASSISVVTEKFLEDTNVKNAGDLFKYTTNTEVGGIQGNYSGQASQTIYTEALITPSNNNRVRGLDAADNTRNYFRSFIPWDSFNVGRVDLQRGPNSVLFGNGSPAGVMNASLNDAITSRDAYKVEVQAGSYGSWRETIDLNQVLLKDELAIRFAALSDDEKYQQSPAFNNTTRYYGALKFDPKLFNSAGSHTEIRANAEWGNVKSNNPRQLPPDDQITWWFLSPSDAHGAGLSKITINEFTPGQGPNSALVNSTVNRTSWAQGRTYWPVPIMYFDNRSSIATQAIIGEWTTGWAIGANGVVQPPNQPGQSTNPGIGGLGNYQPKAVYNYAHYAAGALPGGSYYANKVLTDSSVFDFYNNLLDGNNKREWQHWSAFNVALSQTFLSDRVGFEIAYDQESYRNGQVGFLGGENYAINVDVNQTLIDGSANPNVGRPYVANAAESQNNSIKIDNNSTRVTAFGDLRAEDFLGKSYLAKLLGHHVITGLFSLDHQKQQSVTWSQYALDPQWSVDNNFDLSVKVANYRLFNWVDYIGPDLRGASSAANAHLSNVATTIAPPANSSVRWFNSHWAHSLDPNAPDYVNPSAVYTYVNNDGPAAPNQQVITSNQANNPANYIGWQNLNVNWMDANNPQDFPSLVTGGTKARYRNESKAVVWQGFLLNDEYLGSAVGTFSWRKDSIATYNTGAPIDGRTAVAALDYADDPSSHLATDFQERTWGVVYHVPHFIMKHVPGDTTLSLFYNKGENISAGAPRLNFDGDQIPNSDGLTKEYGAAISTLSDRIVLKVTHYQTTVHYATLSNNPVAGLGGGGYWIWAAPSWGYGYAAQLQAGLDGLYGNTTLNGPGDTAGGTRWNYAARDAIITNPTADLSVLGTPAGAADAPVATYGYGGSGNVTLRQIVNAWLNLPVSDNFFNFWGITGNRPVPAEAHRTGKLYQGFTQPFANGDVPGVGGQQPSGAQNIFSTVDNVSTGWEYELIAQPLKNWDISINYAKTSATKTNIDAATQHFMAANLAFYQGPGGQLRLWGANQTAGYTAISNPGQTPIIYSFTAGQQSGSAVGPGWIANVYNPYLVTAASQGQSAPEVSPWRLNLTTTYTIDRGIAHGAFVGGAVRFEAGRILGYRLSADNSILDVHQPLVGPNDRFFDLWVGYKKNVEIAARKVSWRIQLNMQNVGTKSHLIPSRYEPDGTLALARIQQGMTWQVINSFEF